MHCSLLNNIRFVWLETLTMLVNKMTNIFFNKLKHYIISHYIFMNINNITIVNNIAINRKIALITI